MNFSSNNLKVFQQWNYNKNISLNSKKIKTFNLNFGPQHPAAHGVLRIILQLNGEIIEKLDTHIGLLHRGTEKLIETKKYILSIPYFDRLDYCSMLTQEHSFCLAIEELNKNLNLNLYNLNLRTLFDELTRILNHLLALSCHSLDVGSMSSVFWAFEEREEIMSFYERLSGARMHAAFYKPEKYNDGFLSVFFLDDIIRFTKTCLISLNEIHNMLTYNKIWKLRLINVGIIIPNLIKEYSITGVLARSVGFKEDIRLSKLFTYGNYYNLNFKSFLGWNGDCYDRYLIRLNEMVESIFIINNIIFTYFTNNKFNNNINNFLFKNNIYNNINQGIEFSKMFNLLKHFKFWNYGIKVNKGFIYKSIEAPKGEFGVSLLSDNSNKPYRCKIRSPSFFNLNILSSIIKNCYLADLITLIGTIDIVFGEVDR